MLQALRCLSWHIAFALPGNGDDVAHGVYLKLAGEHLPKRVDKYPHCVLEYGREEQDSVEIEDRSTTVAVKSRSGPRQRSAKAQKRNVSIVSCLNHVFVSTLTTLP